MSEVAVPEQLRVCPHCLEAWLEIPEGWQCSGSAALGKHEPQPLVVYVPLLSPAGMEAEAV